MEKFMEALKKKEEISGRELILGAVTCTLVGIIIGFVAAIPKRPPMPPMPPKGHCCRKGKKDECDDMFED